MFRYLQIFGWFLLTFGVVGFGAIVLGIDPGIGTGPAARDVMALQAMTGLAIYLGFRAHKAGKLSRRVLLYGGWGLILLFVVIGAVRMNTGGA